MPRLDALLGPLADRLRQPLPGHAAHAEMAPFQSRATVETLSVERNEGTPAATLVLLYPGDDGEARFVLTVRHGDMRTHAGQVSLPGGRIEAGETPEDAARREAFEEVGVASEAVTVLGRLTPIYIPPSRFSVWPIVAFVGARPPFVAQETEVTAVLDVALADLLAPDVRQQSMRDAPFGRFNVPYFDLAGHQVWGATAMMLAEVVAVLTSLRAASS